MGNKIDTDDYCRIIHSIKMKCTEIIKSSRKILETLDELTLKINLEEKKEVKNADL